MKSIYVTIAIIGVLMFSQSAAGQTETNKIKQEQTETSVANQDKATVNAQNKGVEVSGNKIRPFPASTKTGKSVSEKEKTKTKQPSNWEKTWSIQAKFTTSFDTNLEHEQVGTKSFGFVPSLTAGYQLRSKNQRWRFIYSFAASRYTMKTDLNRFGNYFAASYRFSAGKFSFETEAEVSLKGTNEDRETNDQYILTQTIGYRFNKKTRFNFYGAYRIRRFPREDAERNAYNPMLGFKFSRQLNKKIDWNLGYRYDQNRAVSPRQNYIRSTYRTGFGIQLTKKDRIDSELSYRPRRYKNRLVEIGGNEFLRRDKKWSFGLNWSRYLTKRWGFETGYEFEKQNSNEVDKVYRNHIFRFSLFFNWANGDLIVP